VVCCQPIIILECLKNSGAYRFIDEKLGGAGTGCVHGIDVHGNADDLSEPNQEDVKDVAAAVKQIGGTQAARDAAKADALRLREMLTPHASWRKSSRAFAMFCGVPLKINPIRIGLACGHMDKSVCGSNYTDRSEAEEGFRAQWCAFATGISEFLANSYSPEVHVISPGVDAGTFAGYIVENLASIDNTESRVHTFLHQEFDEEGARDALETREPGYCEKYNLDPARNYFRVHGSVTHYPQISRRRLKLVEQSQAVLCVAGSIAVEEIVELATIIGNRPIITVGAFGGVARDLGPKVDSANRKWLPELLCDLLSRLATAPADSEQLVGLFSNVIDALSKHMEA